jgi:hypothetical protein
MSEAKLFTQLAQKAQTALERLPEWQRTNRLPLATAPKNSATCADKSTTAKKG